MTQLYAERVVDTPANNRAGTYGGYKLHELV